MSGSGLSVGIIGLPNVGKSTLFNALLKKQAALVANYPFATIEPNVGVVPVPDNRLFELAKIVAFSEHSENSAKSVRQLTDQIFRQSDNSEILSRSEFSGKRLPPIVPATVKFVDIAGLVKGAAEGAGLGNKFLSHIREVSVIAHVVRAFEDENIVKEGSVDPKSDYETIQTELILADLETLEKSKSQFKIQNEIIEGLNTGQPVRNMRLSEEEQAFINSLFLLTAKPEIVVLNVSEKNYTTRGIEDVLSKWSRSLVYETKHGTKNAIVICAKIEAELAALSDEEQKEYLRDLGLEQSGLERLIKKAYETLGLISFLTAGEKEVRAWTVRKGSRAIDAAGEIHTDFVKKFIKAEVVSYDEFISCGGWKGAREKGKTRLEGKDYIMQDGDVVEFKIGN